MIIFNHDYDDVDDDPLPPTPAPSGPGAAITSRRINPTTTGSSFEATTTTSSGYSTPSYSNTNNYNNVIIMHELSGQRSLQDQLLLSSSTGSSRQRHHHQHQQHLLRSLNNKSSSYDPSYAIGHGGGSSGHLTSSPGSSIGGHLELMSGGDQHHWTSRLSSSSRHHRVRPPLLSQGMMGSSLPSRYEHVDISSSNILDTTPLGGSSILRPEFRKASSQPARAVSPALSYHSPTPGQMAAGYSGRSGGGLGSPYQTTMPSSYQPRSRVSSPLSSIHHQHHPIITSRHHSGLTSGQSSISSDIWPGGNDGLTGLNVSSSSIAPLLPSSSSSSSHWTSRHQSMLPSHDDGYVSSSLVAPLLPSSSHQQRRTLLPHQYSSASSTSAASFAPSPPPGMIHHSTGDLYNARHSTLMSSNETISGYRSLEHHRRRPMLNRASTFAADPSSSAGSSFERGGSFERRPSFERGSSFEGTFHARGPPPRTLQGAAISSHLHGGHHLSDAVRTAQLITQYGVRRRVRPPTLAEREGMMGSSLPSTMYPETGAVGGHRRYDPMSDDIDLTTRPEFRKSSSQPARTVSPALSLHSPTQPGGRSSGMMAAGGYNPYTVTDRDLGRVTPGGTEYYEEGSVIKKRVLPQVPSSSSPVTGRHHRYSSEYLQSHHRPESATSLQQQRKSLSDIHRQHHGTDHEVYPYQRLQQQESNEEQNQYQRQYSSGSRPSSATRRGTSPSGHMIDSEAHLGTTSGHVSRRPSYVSGGQEGGSRHGSQQHLEQQGSRRESVSRRESISMQRRDSMTRRGSQSEPRVVTRRYSRQLLDEEVDNYSLRHGHHGQRDTSRDRISSAELMARLKDEGNIYDSEGRVQSRDREYHDDYIRDHPLKDPELTSRVVRRRGAFGTLEGAAEGPTLEEVAVSGSLSGSRQTLTDAGHHHQSRSMARKTTTSGGRILTGAHSYDEEESRHGHHKGPGSMAGSEGGRQLSSSQEKGIDEELQSEAGGSGRGLDTPGDRTESGTGSGPGGRRKHGEGGGAMSKAHSSSTQHLSGAAKKRLGFRKRNAATFFVHRSEEVAPDEVRHMVKQASSTSDGEGSISGESASTWVPAMRLQAEGEVSNFVEGLGPGQLVGRQALAAVNYGDIQLSICERRGNVEVEVIRARNLMAKPGSRIVPATYVKVYMMKQRKCVAKARTVLARRTLDPLYQQQLVFNHDYRETILQITVWGDYGRLDKKVFMGMAQICLDDLDLTNIVIGWYKLLPPTSATITNMAPSAALQEAREAKLAAMAGNMKFFAE